jgi:hypothetical protein
MRVLILGGYGMFGGRLARLLADEPRVTLLVAGRSAAKAAAFCATLAPGAARAPLAFDRDGDVAAQLRAAAPDLVVDASGPFQAYGGEPYRVVAAALALGVSYMDLADGAAFVAGIAAFDAAARAKGVFVLAGVSSFPVLSAAVVRALAAGLVQVDSIAAGIAPSPYAGVGLNVIRAIAGYAGRPVALRRGGRVATAIALVDSRRFTIAPPGRLPLRSRRFSLVEVPDLAMLPALWPDVRSVWMGAGPVPEILHRGLSALAWLVRLRIVPSLAPLAGLFFRVTNVVRWGERRGGMFVAITGTMPDSRDVAWSWHLIAEGDDGPFIPAMAVEAIVRRCLDGRAPLPGARAATGEIALADYEALFRRHAIVSGTREAMPAALPLYRRILGTAWGALPEALRVMHDIGAGQIAAGVATVERGATWRARLAAALFGFPRAGSDVPVTVTFTRRGDAEIWQRDFAGRIFRSTQEAGAGRSEALIVERFGPLAIGLAVVIEGARLSLIVQRWSVLGVPLPLWLGPRSDAHEHAADGRFHFDVALSHPLTGLIVRYRGWLVPRAQASTSLSTSESVGKRPS